MRDLNNEIVIQMDVLDEIEDKMDTIEERVEKAVAELAQVQPPTLQVVSVVVTLVVIGSETPCASQEVSVCCMGYGDRRCVGSCGWWRWWYRYRIRHSGRHSCRRYCR